MKKSISQEKKDDLEAMVSNFMPNYLDFQEFYLNKSVKKQIAANFLISISSSIFITNAIKIFEVSELDKSEYNNFMKEIKDICNGLVIKIEEIINNKKEQ